MGLFGKKIKKDSSNTAAVRQEMQPEFDELTGLPGLNRFYNDAAECIRNYVGTGIALCCTSVGNIGSIDAKFGMDGSGSVLREIARVLTSFDSHIIVSKSGEQFTFLTVYDDEKQLNSWLEELHEVLSGVGRVLDGDPRIYMHTGVYTTGGRLVDLTAEEMRERAMLANAEASKRTHSSFIFYSEQLRIASEEEVILEKDMLTALEKKQFAIYIQPRFDINSGDIIGGKLMSRWHHPQRGVVAAYRYVPLFVKNGFIIKLDIYMLEQTCALIQGWISRGLNPMRMSLNVPRLLVTESEIYVPIYKEMKKKYSIPDGLIELEFSERLLDDSFSAAKKVIEELRSCGYLCAVENYGSGLASDETILESGVNTVKLSRSFFEDGVISEDNRQTITRAVSVAHGAELLVAATGVPDELIDELRGLGCDVIQGRLSLMPLSAEEFTAHLTKE